MKCGRTIDKYAVTEKGFLFTNKAKQRYCYECTKAMGPNLIIDIGNFHAELFTSLMSDRAVSSYLSKCGRYSKELSKTQKKVEVDKNGT